MPTRELRVQLIGDPASLQRAFARAGTSASLLERKFGTVGAAANRVGTQMSSLAKRAALPAAALAVGAGKLAFDFEESMERIRNLVGASEKQVERWSDDLLELGPKLGKSPRELADALYFVTSSGVDAADALDVVKASGKAAALGLGETETVADATTSAMNAYSKSGLDAKEATEVLLQTVKFGKGEPEELAASLGRVLPVSSKLKVDFNDVGAALASLSLQGLDAAESTTALRAIFSATLKPTVDSEEALESVGLSAEALRESLADKGTLATLEMLSEKFKGNEESMARVFPNIRALVGAFSLTGDSAKKNAEIFEGMTGKTNDLGKGFRRLADTDAQNVRETIAELETVGIEAGEALLHELAPAVQEVTDILTDDSLSSDERVSKVIDVLTERMSDAAPHVAEAAAELGIAAVEGLIKGFAQADVLGKVAITAGIIRLFGGPGVFSSIGGVMAERTSAGFKGGMRSGLATLGKGAGIAAALAVGLDALGDEMQEQSDDLGSRLGASLNESWTESLSGTGLAGFLGPILEDADEDFREYSEGLTAALAGYTDKQRDALRGQWRSLEQTGTLSHARFKELLGILDDFERSVPKELKWEDWVAELRKAMRKLPGIADRNTADAFEHFDAFNQDLRGISWQAWQDKMRDVFRTLPRSVRRDTADAFRHYEGFTKDLEGVKWSSWRNQVREIIETLPNSMRRNTRDAYQYFDGFLDDIERQGKGKGKNFRNALKKAFESVADDADKGGFDAFRNWERPLSKLPGMGRKESKRFRDGVVGNYDELSGGGVGAIAILSTETKKTLDSLDVKSEIYTPKVRGQKKQTGGPLKIDGAATGDVVPGLFPEGTFILNRNAAAAMGFQSGGRMVPAWVEPGEVAFPPEMAGAGVEAINDLIPRFAKGGMIHPPGTPGTAVVNAAIAKQVAAWLSKYQSTLTAGYDPGGGHVSPGHNVTGTALDTVPTAGWGAKPRSLFESGLRAALQAGKKVLYGSRGIGMPYAGHGGPEDAGGNAHAHTEWGMGGAVSGAAAEMLKRVILEGPKGVRRTGAQEAIDQVWKAGNKLISKQTVGLSVTKHGTSTYKGPLDRSFAGDPTTALSAAQVDQVRKGAGLPPIFVEVAQRESGFRPGVVSPDGGYGLWQMTPRVQSPETVAAWKRIGNYFNPVDNAVMAKYLYDRGGISHWAPSGPYQRGGYVRRPLGGVARFQAGGSIGKPLGPIRLPGGGGGSGGGGGQQLSAESLLELISILQTQAETTTEITDDVAALNAMLGVLGAQAADAEQALKELSEAPLLTKKDQERLRKEAEARAEGAELSKGQLEKIAAEAKEKAKRRDFGDKKGQALKDAQREAKEEIQERLEKDAEREKEERKADKIVKKLRQKARKEARRERREQQAELISEMAQIASDQQAAIQAAGDALRDQLETQIDAANEATLEAFDAATEQLLANLPGSAELAALKALQETTVDTHDREELLRQLDRARRSESGRLIAEAEYELAVFDRTQRIEELEEQQAAAQEQIEEQRADEREALEAQLQADKEARIAWEVAAQQAMLDQQLAALTENLDLSKIEYDEFAKYVEQIFASLGLDVAVPELPGPGGGGGGGGGGGKPGGPNRPTPNLPGGGGHGGGQNRAGDVYNYITVNAKGAVADSPNALAHSLAHQITTRRRLAGAPA